MNQLKQEIVQIKKHNELLIKQLMNTSMISELTKVLHATTTLENMYNTLMVGINEIIGFDRIIFFSIDKKKFSLTPKASIGIDTNVLSKLQIPLSFEGGEITDAIFLNRHIIVKNPSADEDIMSQYLKTKEYVVIPLVGRGIPYSADNTFTSSMNIDSDATISEDQRRKQIICSCDFSAHGVVWLDQLKPDRLITSDDITILSSIINQAGIILESFRMFEAIDKVNHRLQNTNKRLNVANKELQNAHDKINKDLEHARSIQQGLLPQALPEAPEISIKASYLPADAVGGDYYDAFEIDKGIYGIIVADVSGHGIASSLIMSMVKVLLKTYAQKKCGPQKTLEMINEIFQTEINTNNFVTVFYGIVNTNAHTFVYTSAGHCPVLFIDRNTKSANQIKADGLFLGVFSDMMLSESTMHYIPDNNRIVLYTDGLTEARNTSNEMFDLNRLKEISLETLTLTQDIAIDEILSSQKKFCGSNTIPEDDITLVLIDF